MTKTYVIDLFCGAGGTSSAIFLSDTGLEVIACINHDINAIRSHAENYPNCIHYTEDIRTVSLKELAALVQRLRVKEPGCKIAIWASLECTHFSKAKGGQSRNADSRTLAEHLFRYDDIIKPDFFWIENVREFLTWGPLDENGMPIKELKCSEYDNWVNEFNSRGYTYDYKILNAANYGAYTSRIRYFGQFSKNAHLINWPIETHSKKGELLSKWKPVKEVLDLEDEGQSIFARKKPHVDATLNRLYAGLLKFVDGSDTNFLCSYYKNSTFVNENEPCGTLTTKDRFQKVSVKFIQSSYSNGGEHSSLNNPCPTLLAIPKQNVVTVLKKQYLLNPQYKNKGNSIDKPCFTLIARMDKAPPYLISVLKYNKPIVINDYDSDSMIKIKEFMIKNGIADIRMRMLQIKEMLRIQGFPSNYILRGTQTEQKKYIGNSVEVNVAIALFQAIDKSIQNEPFEYHIKSA